MTFKYSIELLHSVSNKDTHRSNLHKYRIKKKKLCLHAKTQNQPDQRDILKNYKKEKEKRSMTRAYT